MHARPLAVWGLASSLQAFVAEKLDASRPGLLHQKAARPVSHKAFGPFSSALCPGAGYLSRAFGSRGSSLQAVASCASACLLWPLLSGATYRYRFYNRYIPFRYLNQYRIVLHFVPLSIPVNIGHIGKMIIPSIIPLNYMLYLILLLYI